MSLSITEEVVQFQQTGRGWKALSDRICLYAYRYPRLASDWDEDRCSDFFMSFYPRIRRLVERYRPEYSFETYLCSCLKWHMKTFLDHVAAGEYYDDWWTDPDRAEMDGCGSVMELSEGIGYPAAMEQETESGTGGRFRTDSTGRIADPAFRRRFLYVLMLKAADLSGSQVEALAKLVGRDPRNLADNVRSARETVAWKVEARERLRRRRNECWYRMKDAARRSRAEEVCEGNRYREWKRKEQTWRSRYESASRHLKVTKVHPTHRDISRILGVPQGTISSGLHLLRRKLDRQDLNV